MGESKCKLEITIPDALIMEIFGKLPAKSLCRFKCASKFCLSFIEDQLFINTICAKPPIKWFVLDKEMIEIYSIDSNGFATCMRRYEFEDGLACFKYCDGLHCFYSRDLGLSLYNPTTEESFQLCFDPWFENNRCCPRFEFSFDPLSKKYKILFWWRKYHSEDILEFQILTLENGLSWRPVANTLGQIFLFDATTACDGKLFWTENRRIISFNLANEEFGEIGLPADFTENNGFAYTLFEFEGSLTLVEQRKYGRVISFWMLKNVDGGFVWSLMKRNLTLRFEATDLNDFYDGNNVDTEACRLLVSWW